MNKKNKWFENQQFAEENKTDPRGKTYYESFAEYAEDFSDAKELELLYYINYDYQLIKLATKYGAFGCGITGDYFSVTLGRGRNDWYLRAQDNDDSSVLLVGTELELKKTLEQIKFLAPLDFCDLVNLFGFIRD